VLATAPDEGDLLSLLSRVANGPWTLDLISTSSSFVYRAQCEDRDKAVAVRVPRLSKEKLSAFWQQLVDVFGFEYPASSAHLEWIASHIREVGRLAAPALFTHGVVGGREAIVTEWLDGTTWEPDRFPDDDAVCARLGDFLGRMHNETASGFGPVLGTLSPPSDYVAAAAASIEATLDRHWTHNDAKRIRDVVRRERSSSQLVSDFCPVMPDISGNQFLYNDTGIAGVVDLDAYVVGPVELELTVVEWCLPRPDAFRGGYEGHRQLPSFAPFRDFHRATVLVNEPALAGDVERLLHENVHFD
jgi:hypothetical protein